jgi:LCP family protein required for cell wall assembly
MMMEQTPPPSEGMPDNGDGPSSGVPADSVSPAGPVAGTRRAGKPPGFFRRHWLATVLTSLVTVLMLVTGVAYGYYWYLNRQLDGIPRVDVGITKKTNAAPDNKTALNILMVGVDNGSVDGSIKEDVAKASWPIGSHRTDTIMLVHIPANRKTVSMISIPRDTWVRVPDCAKYPDYLLNCRAKINAAFSLGGPKLMVHTIRNFTGISLDHFVAIDWRGFKDLTSALGGVKVYIPQSFYDSSQKYQWNKGWQTLKGDVALKYVRTRYDLPDGSGDFGRIARQQNFLRATMKQLLSSSVRHNPLKFLHVVDAVAKYLTVDNGWSTSEMRDLALSMRGISSKDVKFLTLKTTAGWSKSIPPQSIQVVNPHQTKMLFRAFAHGTLARYVKHHPGMVKSLSGSKKVS